MAEINLTLIQTFYLVARHGSYSAAAREMNLSYQSAANHVRRLEQVMHERLVESDQGAKKIRLTPRGVAVVTTNVPSGSRSISTTFSSKAICSW